MDEYKDITDLTKDISFVLAEVFSVASCLIKHIVDEENDRECWVTSDGQAHYDIKVATLRQLELLNNAL